MTAEQKKDLENNLLDCINKELKKGGKENHSCDCLKINSLINSLININSNTIARD